jgi:hypothetical protein
LHIVFHSSSVTSSSVPLSFIHGSVHYTENIKGIRTWKIPHEINNNIFHGANKLQEKNTCAFSNWTLQIKSLMKSALAKHFQNLVRCNSYLGPLITSPPQITVFTLYVIHALSTGTYNYKFYAYYWSLYKIQVLSWHVQWHYLYFNKMWVFLFFFIKPHLYCTYVMHISGSFHYLYQFSFFCACHKLEPSFPKQSQIVIKIIMVYTITHLINSMVTQRLLPIGYSYGKRLHSSTEIKKISIFYHQQNW